MSAPSRLSKHSHHDFWILSLFWLGRSSGEPYEHAYWTQIVVHATMGNIFLDSSILMRLLSERSSSIFGAAVKIGRRANAKTYISMILTYMSK